MKYLDNDYLVGSWDKIQTWVSDKEKPTTEKEEEDLIGRVFDAAYVRGKNFKGLSLAGYLLHSSALRGRMVEDVIKRMRAKNSSFRGDTLVEDCLDKLILDKIPAGSCKYEYSEKCRLRHCLSGYLYLRVLTALGVGSSITEISVYEKEGEMVDALDEQPDMTYHPESMFHYNEFYEKYRERETFLSENDFEEYFYLDTERKGRVFCLIPHALSFKPRALLRRWFKEHGVDGEKVLKDMKEHYDDCFSKQGKKNIHYPNNKIKKLIHCANYDGWAKDNKVKFIWLKTFCEKETMIAYLQQLEKDGVL